MATSTAPGLRSRRRSGPHPRRPPTSRCSSPGSPPAPARPGSTNGDDRAFRRRTSWCWQAPAPAPTPAARDLDQVFIDDIWLHHDWVLLIARTTTDVNGWQWAVRESTTAYQALLAPSHHPRWKPPTAPPEP
ncbi:hypothetical protein [Actinomyces oris]|uniref:hypothetical protein n=1 Tax=Actinomyces oris TaxID=544580 RepID=UPI0028D00AEF|nr:hypothetical protein [Actinomyces oris]